LRLYIDTSAAAKLLVEEEESAALAKFCDQPEAELVATDLLETELRRFAVRGALPQADVSVILSRIVLHEIPRSSYVAAGLFPGAGLRSLDARHLAGAQRLGVDGVITYDDRFADAAVGQGFVVLAPRGH
jgi:predicted nucleic acid-binding protein